MSTKTHLSTKPTVCTKRIKTTIITTSKGPVEKREEVLEGGPGCQISTELSGGELGALFPTLSQASSSSSSSSSVHTGDSKGSLLGGFRTELVDPFDFGAFKTANGDEDVPDFHARSIKSTHVERKADYVGKGTQPSALD